MINITTVRAAALACAAFVVLFANTDQASAATYVNIRVGSPPPPLVVEHPWARPYRGAVWIAGHHEWVRGGWVWVPGYYSYPPRRGMVWVSGSYHHGYWHAGYWR